MTTLSTIAKKTFNKDIKSQVEAGYLDSTLRLTSLGQLVLLQEFYFNGGSELLSKRAEAILAEREAKK